MNPGKYKAKALGGALGYTSGDAPQIAVELQVLEGESSGETITWYGYFTDKTHDRTLAALRTLGWSTDDLSDLQGIDANEVSIVVDDEEYDGNIQTRVKWINPLGGLGLKKPMTPEQAKAFAAKMKGAAVASRGASGGPAKSPPKAKAPPKQTRQTPPDDYNEDLDGRF